MMTEDQPRREDGNLAAASPPLAGEIRMVAPLEDDEEGGDPVCWAHLVCDECGAITTEGHRAGCSRQGAGYAGEPEAVHLFTSPGGAGDQRPAGARHGSGAASAGMAGPTVPAVAAQPPEAAPEP